MLPGRIREHVRTRDWTGVAADLVIVIAGVFIGLQAQQWAEGRELRRLEASYIERLHDEVVSLQATRATLVELRSRWAAKLASVTDLLFGNTERPLTEEECRAVAFSYAVTNPTDDLASLLELQTSVGLSTISSEAVSAALRDFLLTRTRTRDANAGIMASVRVLGAEHPNLVRVRTPTAVAGGLVPGTFECDVDGMRGDAAFRNDYEFMQSNFALHVDLNARVSASLAALHRALDATLGLEHGPGAAGET